jgi:hypothetical protein
MLHSRNGFTDRGRHLRRIQVGCASTANGHATAKLAERVPLVAAGS